MAPKLFSRICISAQLFYDDHNEKIIVRPIEFLGNLIINNIIKSIAVKTNLTHQIYIPSSKYLIYYINIYHEKTCLYSLN